MEVIHNTYHWQLGDDSKRAIRSLADQFVAVSRSARDYAVALGIDAGKTVVVNNGLLPDGFAQPSISEMDRLRGDFEFRILQVANIYGHKCHNTLLTAFERFYRDHAQARLIFAGDVVEPEVHQQLVRRIEAYGLKDVVTFTGHVDRIALGRLYASAHVSVLPSIVEGFSIASLSQPIFVCRL